MLRMWASLEKKLSASEAHQVQWDTQMDQNQVRIAAPQ
jgi:hypothetical protein